MVAADAMLEEGVYERGTIDCPAGVIVVVNQEIITYNSLRQAWRMQE